MAVQMQPVFVLPEKFEKLKFGEYGSTDSMSTPSTPSTPQTPEPYEVKFIKEEDAEKVLEFLRNFFFRDEPLNINVKLLDNEDTCKELEEYSVKSIKDNLSFMAVSESGKVVGISLNGCLTKADPPEDVESCPNPKFRKILKLLDHVEAEAGVFEKYPDVEKIMIMKIVSVDGTWRGRGLAKTLMDRTRDLAREQGFGLMRVDCTSHFSARAVARLGFDCVYTLKYEDYNVDGKVVFNPEPPHTEVKVYTQRI